ncbi:hypothetical protein [Rhodococcus koreensis]
MSLEGLCVSKRSTQNCFANCIRPAIPGSIDDPDHGHERLADRVDDLVGILHSHLAHEEREAVPLIRETITAEEWQRLSKDTMHDLTYREKADAAPYLLEGASEERVRVLLDMLPPPLRLMYRHR